MDPRPDIKKHAIPDEVLHQQVTIDVNADETMLNFLKEERSSFCCVLPAIGFSSSGEMLSMNVTDLEVELEGDLLKGKMWLHGRYTDVLKSPEMLAELNVLIAKEIGEEWSLIAPEQQEQADFNAVDPMSLVATSMSISSRDKIPVHRKVDHAGYEVDEHVATFEIPPTGFTVINFRSQYVEIKSPEQLQSEIESFVKLGKCIVDIHHKLQNTLPPKEEIRICNDTNTSPFFKREAQGRKTNESVPTFIPHLSDMSFEDALREEIIEIQDQATDPELKEVAQARIEKVLSQLKLLTAEAQVVKKQLDTSEEDVH